MSQVEVQQALEKALIAVDPAFEYVPPNSGQAPSSAATPYMTSFLLPNDPDNSASGAIYCDRGLFKVHVKYPIGDLTKNATAKAEAIRAAFKRATTFTQGGVNVLITHTPTISGGFEDAGYWLVPVTISWQAWVFS